jgi:hypothetical protein
MLIVFDMLSLFTHSKFSNSIISFWALPSARALRSYALQALRAGPVSAAIPNAAKQWDIILFDKYGLSRLLLGLL